MTLDDLPSRYQQAREVASASAEYTPETCPALTCRYCGKFRKPLPGARLDGHAKCVVSPEFIAEIDKLYRSIPTLSRKNIAETLGVSTTVAILWTTDRVEPDFQRIGDDQ